MAGQVHHGPVQHQLLVGGQPRQQGLPQGLGHARRAQAAQAGAVGAQLVRLPFVESLKRVPRGGFQCLRLGGAQGQAVMHQRVAGQGIGRQGGQALCRGKAPQIDAVRRHRQQGGQAPGGARQAQGVQLGQALRRAAVAHGGQRVKHAPAGQGAAGGGVAQQHALAMPGAHRGMQHQLRPGAGAGRQRVGVEQGHGGVDVGRAQVRLHAGARAQRPRLAGPQGQPQVDALAGQRHPGGAQPLAARHGVARQPGQGDGAALAGVGLLDGAVLRVQAAHAGVQPAGHDGQLVAHAHRARVNGAGDHGAGALQAEGAVDRQAKGF